MSKRAAYTFLFIVPALAFALLATERAAFAQPDEELGDETTGEVGIGSSFFNQFGGDEENFLVLSFRPVIKLGNLWMGLNFTVPLDSSGEVREDAFNEETDYLAMIRFLQWGKERDFLYFRFGELSQATIGHGSIVHNYFNGLDYNSPKTGGRLNLNWGWAGVETMVSDIYSFSTDTKETEGLVAARAYVRPFRILGFGLPFVKQFALGVTTATDAKAPKTLSTSIGGSGDPVIDLDSDGNIITLEDEQVQILGADIEYYLIGGEDALIPGFGILSILPYADYNQIKNHGWGKHYGVLLEIDINEVPLLGSVLMGLVGKLEIQFERREAKRNYIPGYFDSLYEIQRYQYPTTSDLTTKQSQIDNTGVIRGWFGSGSLTIFDALKISMSFEDYDDDEALGKVTVGARLKEGVLEGWKFRAEFTRTGVSNFDNLFKLDENALLKADFGMSISSLSFGGAQTFINVHFERSWVLDTTTGLYTEVDIFEPSISMQWTF
jgi:hypothetical protein